MREEYKLMDAFPIFVLNVEPERQMFFKGMSHAMEIPFENVIFRSDGDVSKYDFDVDAIIDAAISDGFAFFENIKKRPRFEDMGNINPNLLGQSLAYCRILRDIANSDAPVAAMVHDDVSLRVPYWRLLSLCENLFELKRDFYMLQMGVDVVDVPLMPWNTLLSEEDENAYWYYRMMDYENPLRIFRNGIRGYYDCGWLLSPMGAMVLLQNFDVARTFKFETAIGWGAHLRFKELAEDGKGVYTSKDNTVTLCKRDFYVGSSTD